MTLVKSILLASVYGSGPYGSGPYNGTSSGGLVNTGSRFVWLVSAVALLFIVVVAWLWFRRKKYKK